MNVSFNTLQKTIVGTIPFKLEMAVFSKNCVHQILSFHQFFGMILKTRKLNLQSKIQNSTKRTVKYLLTFKIMIVNYKHFF